HPATYPAGAVPAGTWAAGRAAVYRTAAPSAIVGRCDWADRDVGAGGFGGAYRRQLSRTAARMATNNLKNREPKNRRTEDYPRFSGSLVLRFVCYRLSGLLARSSLSRSWAWSLNTARRWFTCLRRLSNCLRLTSGSRPRISSIVS